MMKKYLGLSLVAAFVLVGSQASARRYSRPLSDKANSVLLSKYDALSIPTFSLEGKGNQPYNLRFDSPSHGDIATTWQVGGLPGTWWIEGVKSSTMPEVSTLYGKKLMSNNDNTSYTICQHECKFKLQPPAKPPFAFNLEGKGNKTFSLRLFKQAHGNIATTWKVNGLLGTWWIEGVTVSDVPDASILYGKKLTSTKDNTSYTICQYVPKFNIEPNKTYTLILDKPAHGNIATTWRVDGLHGTWWIEGVTVSNVPPAPALYDMKLNSNDDGSFYTIIP